MLDTVKINHVQHISFTQSRLTDAVSVILSELLSYEHPSKRAGLLLFHSVWLRISRSLLITRISRSAADKEPGSSSSRSRRGVR